MLRNTLSNNTDLFIFLIYWHHWYNKLSDKSDTTDLLMISIILIINDWYYIFIYVIVINDICALLILLVLLIGSYEWYYWYHWIINISYSLLILTYWYYWHVHIFDLLIYYYCIPDITDITDVPMLLIYWNSLFLVVTAITYILIFLIYGHFLCVNFPNLLMFLI